MNLSSIPTLDITGTTLSTRTLIPCRYTCPWRRAEDPALSMRPTRPSQADPIQPVRKVVAEAVLAKLDLTHGERAARTRPWREPPESS